MRQASEKRPIATSLTGMGGSVEREFVSIEGWVIVITNGVTLIGRKTEAGLSPVYALSASYAPGPPDARGNPQIAANRIAVPFLTFPSIEVCPIPDGAIAIPCESLSLTERRILLVLHPQRARHGRGLEFARGGAGSGTDVSNGGPKLPGTWGSVRILPAPSSPAETIQTYVRQLEERNGFLESEVRRLANTPLMLGLVMRADEEKVSIRLDQGEMREVDTPPGFLNLRPQPIVVRVHPQTGAIVDPADDTITDCFVGAVWKVIERTDKYRAFVEAPGGVQRNVSCSFQVKPGDRVMVDGSQSVAIKNLGPEPPKVAPAFLDDTGVTWDDVGGLEAAKRELIEAIEEPILHREVYERYGKKPTKGVLLWGPPGTGKTMLGKAVASAIAKLYGKKGSGFIYVKGPEVLNKWQGESEAGVRRIFESARQHKKDHGYPAVVFIDEADALLGKRGGMIERSEKTIVPAFLAEMDGLDDSGALLLLATNRADALDPAVVRDGRVDKKIHVPRPTRAECVDIATRHLKKKPCDAKLADAIADHLFDEKHALHAVHVKSGPRKHVTLASLASGALVAGIVERATQLAIRRELAGGDEKQITSRDVAEAVAMALRENRGLDHAQLIEEFVEPFKGDVVSVDRVRDGEITGGRILRI